MPFFASNMKLPMKIWEDSKFIGLHCGAWVLDFAHHLGGVSLECIDVTDCKFDIVMLINEYRMIEQAVEFTLAQMA